MLLLVAIRLYLFLLLILFGCDSPTNSPFIEVLGCTDQTACNFDESANTDDGTCQHLEINFDCNGNCLLDMDCNGDCGGSALEDECGICDGDNTSCTDCAGVPNGVSTLDNCGVCGGDDSSCLDDETVIFSGITETDSSGNMIGNIDSHDWCSFDMNLMNGGYGLNPIYPNPVTAQNSELFGYSYQICYQYSTPYDSTFTNFNHIYIDIVSVNNDTIYSFEDNFANGPFGSCTFIADTLVVDSIYRMYLTSDDWNCFGDIEFQ